MFNGRKNTGLQNLFEKYTIMWRNVKDNRFSHETFISMMGHILSKLVNDSKAETNVCNMEYLLSMMSIFGRRKYEYLQLFKSIFNKVCKKTERIVYSHTGDMKLILEEGVQLNCELKCAPNVDAHRIQVGFISPWQSLYDPIKV